MRMIAIVLGVLGGIIGLVSAISAFVAVGADPAYSVRLWAGWLALLLAVLAGVAALFMTTRPAAAGLTMLIGGFAGFVCINLFYINTFYGLAVCIVLGARKSSKGTEKLRCAYRQHYSSGNEGMF